MKEKDQSFCPKCHRMYCEGYWGEGVCIADMSFCGEPTADGDEAARCLRVWYEAHRESWMDRHWTPFGGAAPARYSEFSDNFMLGLISEVHRIESQRFFVVNGEKSEGRARRW